jgi:hypothetical protein
MRSVRKKRTEISTCTNAALSVGIFAQQRRERPLARAASFSYRFEENLREFNRTFSAETINLPSPWFRLWRPPLHNYGKVFVTEHSARHIK